MKKYLVHVGLNYDPKGKPFGDPLRKEVRAEPGDVVDDLPKTSIPWLLEQGHISLHEESE